MFRAPFFEYHTNFYGLDMVIWSVVGAVLMITLMISLVIFLLKGFGLFEIARRRGIRKAWLSWLPVGQDWIRGSISDQYRYLTAGKIQHRRVILSVISAVSLVLQTMGTVMILRHLAFALTGIRGYRYDAGYHMFRLVFAGSGITFLATCAGIMRIVFHHMCMYDLYRSADPRNDTAMTVLGIIVPILEPFFVLSEKEKDEGMPPRRDRAGAGARRPENSQTERPMDPVYDTPTDGPEQL